MPKDVVSTACVWLLLRTFEFKYFQLSIFLNQKVHIDHVPGVMMLMD